LPASGKDSLTFYIGYQSNQQVGTAIASYSNEGYDATQIQIMVGFLPDGIIKNTAVTQHKETPGLGTKMSDPGFKDQFMNINSRSQKTVDRWMPLQQPPSVHVPFATQ